MSSINFTTGTIIPATWLNDVNTLVYTVFNASGTAAAARTALGLGTMATQNASAVAITGGTMTNVAITNGSISGAAISGGTIGTTTITGSTISVTDSNLSVTGSSDATKILKFEVDGFTTATQRTLTPPNADLTLPVIAAKGAIPAATAANVLGSLAVGTDGQIIQADSSQSTGLVYRSKLVSLGVVNSTSGTSIDFTGIPSWAKRVTITFQGVSTTGTSGLRIQMGTSGGVETTGYLGASGSFLTSGNAVANTTSGFDIQDSLIATSVRHGALTLTLHNSATNTWAISGNMGESQSARVMNIGGIKPLAAVLDRVRITTVGGTDTFDAGSINVTYE